MTLSIDHVLAKLQDEYLALHTRKEDLFWTAKMGLAPDSARTQRELAAAEIDVNRFLQAPERLLELRQLDKEGAASAEQRQTLHGWIALFSAHVVEDPRGRKQSEEIVEAEQALEHARGSMKLGYVDPTTKQFVPASSVKLALMVRTERDEALRKAAFDGLRSIEAFVLNHGFLDIVKKRNALGRLLGYEDYYDWRVSVVENMRKRRLFEVLDELERKTAAGANAELARFAAEHGEASLAPWSFGFLRAGQLTRALDPYFSFSSAFGRWGRSFAALGVKFRGAVLSLDLVDRAGKYENGFMHGPGPAFFDRGTWRSARINFTANAIPGQVGSGLRATETLFHEGGHAAHFSNILSNAPCFSQEFAPTSVAYAETQSMFMDSLLGDPDWRALYATDANGKAMPLELIESAIRETQPFRGWDVRAMLSVPFGERAIYEIPDAELGPERVLADLRRVEERTLGLPLGSPRPVLAVPHLLAGESSAYYHGYILAEMAVQQTRAFFTKRDGYLVDNGRIGPDLAKHYWAPGNAVPFEQTLRDLTGHGLRADALVDTCNESVDAAIERARGLVASVHTRGPYDGPIDLDATVRVCHGGEIIASTERGGFQGAKQDFERWIATLEANAPS